ncbi:GNAT family N-acetyltransferase [Actinokineospora sp. NBRC 105648]|uniref:GNAT family N-acetyltransferase n=1 Tax=Actinokineospora sp. NBRC 105648 TaxID=3032206 RepID=UPI0024A40EFB|nr:GNAT family N-acetyltransferase [Actinokineospora sp. NBRC 105648]GLZ39672.1 N-acetyltransferase [Actinokineospora sp. NBRC 105648]
MIVRQATDADIASVALLRRLWTDEDDGKPSGDPDFEATFAEWWAQERSRREFWIAEDTEPVGFISLVEFSRMPRPTRPPSKWGYISNFYVRLEYRSAGVGQELLAAALKHADERGYVRVVLSPTVRAIPLYQRAGFGPADSLMLRQPPTTA